MLTTLIGTLFPKIITETFNPISDFQGKPFWDKQQQPQQQYLKNTSGTIKKKNLWNGSLKSLTAVCLVENTDGIWNKIQHLMEFSIKSFECICELRKSEVF